jgi:hypothetical protein
MSQHLIQLVKSLTRTEKRYVHLNLKTFSFDNGSSQLLNDFLLLEKKASLKSTVPIIKAQGNATRLYYKILDILFALHKEQLHDNENDNSLIKRSQVLFHKGFYKEGTKLLNKVIYRGYTYSYLLRIEAIEIKIKAAIKFVDVDYINDNFENDKKLLAEFSTYYFNQVELESMWAMIKVESTTNYFFGGQNSFADKYSAILSNEENALSPTAKLYHNQINGFLAMKQADPNKAYEYMKRTQVIFNWYPELKENNFSEYLRSNRNLCIVLQHQKKYNEASAVIDAVSKTIELHRKRRSHSLKNDIFTITILVRMGIIISSSAIKENIDRIKQFEIGLEENDEFIALDEKITCNYYLSIMHLHANNFRKALRFVNEAISLSGTVRKDIHHVALLAEMVIHYNLGNADLLFSRLASFKRMVDKGDVVFSFEVQIPKLLNDLFNHPNENKYFNKLFKVLDDSLEEENKLGYKPFITLYLLKCK